MKQSGTVAIGLAMFTMLFGAGNVIYPLVLGRVAGSHVMYALVGFCITAALVPLIGFVATLLCGGSYRKFLGRVGTGPAFVITFACMVLIGPFCAIPRCVTLAHSALSWYVPMPMFLFSIISGILIFACTVNKKAIVPLLGKVFGPIKLILLGTVITVGMWSSKAIAPGALTKWESIYKGFADGYGTMDLLGVIFFAGLISSGMGLGSVQKGTATVKVVVKRALIAGGIGCSLLALVYTGFCIVAARYAPFVKGVASTELFTALTAYVLGPYGGIVASLTIFITCFTTSIVLSAVFADYLKHSIFRGKQPYLACLAVTILLSSITANLGFESLMSLVEPLIALFYPGLIFLALVNIIFVMFVDKRDKRAIIASIVDETALSELSEKPREFECNSEQHKELR